MCRSLTLVLSLLLTSFIHADPNWPQFRGADASGIVKGNTLPAKWSSTENVAWKKNLPGEAWSSPIVWGKKIFLTNFISNEKVTAPRKGFYAPRQTKKPNGECSWMVLCLDSESGKMIWEKTAHKGIPQHTVHVKGSFASETPVTDGEHVYAYFGNVGLFCYDMNGKQLWSKKFDVVPTTMGWGLGSSPTLYKDRIYILNDNRKESWLLALNKKTGREIWKVQRQEKGSWATPYIWENSKRTEIITCAPGKARSYSLDGKLLWEIRKMSSICVPTPVAAHGMLYINSGYEFGGGARPVYAIRPGAEGDISLKAGEKNNEFIAWYQPRGGSYHPSTLVHGDYAYVLYSAGSIACFDAKTGKQLYKERLGGVFTASPWADKDKIYCLNEAGETFVVKAGSEFKLLEKNSLEDMSLATPAILGDQILIRTHSALFCIGSAK